MTVQSYGMMPSMTALLQHQLIEDQIASSIEGTKASPNLASALDSISCLALSRYSMLGKWFTYWSSARRKRCTGGPPALKLTSS